MFASVEEVQERFRQSLHREPPHRHGRLPRQPDEPARPGGGPAGVGRPSWPRCWPRRRDGRSWLQCYEGLDEAKALYEWKYAKQLLYTQMLRERIGELIADAPPDRRGRSHRATGGRVLLPPVPLAAAPPPGDPGRRARRPPRGRDRQGGGGVRGVPARGALRLAGLGAGARDDQGAPPPLVVLTSNNARELTDGLKRRCLHLFIDFPGAGEELAIIRLKVPEVSEQLARQVVSAVQKIRALELGRRRRSRRASTGPGPW